MEPQVIKDTPLPTIATATDIVQGAADPTMPSVDSQNGVQPPTVPDTPFHPPTIAVAVVSESLNTQSRQILGAFTFGQVGALKVGNYVNGVSGELDITPNGITAKNSNGVTTFSIDGTTGNATFLGTIQAGTLISGNIIVGGSGNGDGIIQVVDASNTVVVQMDNTGITIYNGKLTIQDVNGTTVVDSQGVNSVSQFSNGSAAQGSVQTTTNTSFQDISGTSISFTLARTANVLVAFSASGFNTRNLSGSPGSDDCLVAVNIDGSDQSQNILLPGSQISDTSGIPVGLVANTGGYTLIVQLGAGSHTIKMRFRSQNGGTAETVYATLSYAVLGK